MPDPAPTGPYLSPVPPADPADTPAASGPPPTGLDSVGPIAHAAAVRGKRLAAGGQHPERTAGDVRVIDTATGKTEYRFAPAGPTRGVVFSPDGKAIVAGGDGGRVELRGLGQKEAQYSVPVPKSAAVRGLAFPAGGKRFWTADTDLAIHLCHETTRTPLPGR